MDDLAAAFMLLTRLPVGWLARRHAPGAFGDSVWAYPLAGAAVGGVAAAIYAGCHRLGVPPAVCAVWALGGLVLASGAFHEDGLADTADGIGGGRTRERKLEIMRDSRIGSYGALALLLAMAARGTALAAMADPARVAAALVASAALGRAAIIVVLIAADPARPDGLAAGLRDLRPARVAAGLALAVGIAGVLLPRQTAAIAIGAALLAAVAVSLAARRYLGGYTGDVLGAACVAAECAALSLLAGATP
jgi:adenosylcobinamide-GDP ribazoletransferase